MSQTTDPAMHRDLPFAYLTTRGRKTGTAHTIEIWFALDPRDPTRLFMMAGGGWKSDWVRNLTEHPMVSIKLDRTAYPATAAVMEAGDASEPLVRRLLAAKYQDWQEGQPLSEWAQTALPVAYTLDVVAARPVE